LDNPDNRLIREIAQRAHDELLGQVQELKNKEDSEVGKIKMKTAWMLRSTLESLLPDIKLDENVSPGRKRATSGSLLQPRNAGQGKEAEK